MEYKHLFYKNGSYLSIGIDKIYKRHADPPNKEQPVVSECLARPTCPSRTVHYKWSAGVKRLIQLPAQFNLPVLGGSW